MAVLTHRCVLSEDAGVNGGRINRDHGGYRAIQTPIDQNVEPNRSASFDEYCPMHGEIRLAKLPAAVDQTDARNSAISFVQFHRLVGRE